MANPPKLREKYWETVPLNEMTKPEWEALCDGCGRCCLIKLEDEDTAEVVFTTLACKMLDCKSALCSDYKNRKKHVPDCVQLTPQSIATAAYWLPKTCAYLRLHEGNPIPTWHPLLTGTPDSVADAGISMAGLTTSETVIDRDEDAIAYIDDDLG